MAYGSSTAQLEVEYSAATAAARLLAMFAELPSTPVPVAQEAAAAARGVSIKIPTPPGLGGGSGHPAPTGSVTLEREAVIACAGLLDVLSGLPSTPPDLRVSADDVATTLWDIAEAR